MAEATISGIVTDNANITIEPTERVEIVDPVEPTVARATRPLTEDGKAWVTELLGWFSKCESTKGGDHDAHDDGTSALQE